MFIDERLDAALRIIGRSVEICLEASGYDEARLVQPTHEQLKGFLVIKPDTHLTVQLADDLNDLRGIAHGRILLRRAAISATRCIPAAFAAGRRADRISSFRTSNSAAVSPHPRA